MLKNEILDFYKKTSPYTDLGLYSDFVKNLPDDIGELCLLQRNQIIHPFDMSNEKMRKNSNSCYGDMTKVPKTVLCYENDLFHWITEYYDTKKEKWTLVDADMYFYEDVLNEYHIDFNLLDIPYDKFIFGAEAYLGLRTGKFKNEDIYYALNPLTIGIEASIHGLFYDFHSLMNNEIIFLHLPKYIIDKKFKLSEEEYIELDELAKLMLNPENNFDKLLKIWNSQDKFRIMSGGMNV